MLNIGNRADLQQLVDNRIPESIELEYKASPALNKSDGARNELSKDASALANSAGGQLIYGISEDANRVPSGIDQGVDPKEITSEWLEQVLNTRIAPRMEGVKITSIPLTAMGDRVAYVISVPQAQVHAPHQAADKKYYKRFNFMSVPMEDYEIRDVLRRATSPEPFIEFSIDRNAPAFTIEDGDEFSSSSQIQTIIGNRSNTPASWLICRVFVDSDLNVMDGHGFEDNSQGQYGDQSVLILKEKLGAIDHFPIFKETKFSLKAFSVRLPRKLIDATDNYYLGYHIATPGYSGGRMHSLRLENRRLRFVEIDPPRLITI